MFLKYLVKNWKKMQDRKCLRVGFQLGNQNWKWFRSLGYWLTPKYSGNGEENINHECALQVQKGFPKCMHDVYTSTMPNSFHVSQAVWVLLKHDVSPGNYVHGQTTVKQLTWIKVISLGHFHPRSSVLLQLSNGFAALSDNGSRGHAWH